MMYLRNYTFCFPILQQVITINRLPQPLEISIIEEKRKRGGIFEIRLQNKRRIVCTRYNLADKILQVKQSK